MEDAFVVKDGKKDVVRGGEEILLKRRSISRKRNTRGGKGV